MGDYSNELQYAVGVGSGYGVYKGARQVIKNPISRFYQNLLCNVPKNENDILWNAANKAYENSNLKDSFNYKNVKNCEGFKTIFGEIKLPNIITRKRAEIIDINPSNVEKITKNVVEQLGLNQKNPILDSKLYKILFGDKKAQLEGHIKLIADGKNACHVSKTGQVLVNKEKMAFSTFHELGHAMNATGTGIGKFLNKNRGLFALCAPLIFGVGLLKNTEHNKNDRNIFDFIKDNCGILTGLCFVPTILEEGKASLNAAKLAKPYLDKNMYKKLNILNGKAWSSYVLSAIVTAACVKAGVYIRDLVVNDKTKVQM